MIKISEVNFNQPSRVSHYSRREFLIRVSRCNNGKMERGSKRFSSDLRSLDPRKPEGGESIRGGKVVEPLLTKAYETEAVEIINALHVREFASPR